MKHSTRAFFGAALIWLLLAAVLHVLASIGMQHAWAAMIHTTVFGWITTMMIAVTYHTMPVFAARDFPDQRLIWAHGSLLAAGVGTTVAGLLSTTSIFVSIGLLLETSASLLFVFNTITLFRRGLPRSARPPMPAIASQPQVDSIATKATRASGICLPAALGIMLVTTGASLTGQWYLAAEHLALLGWVMLMIVGVGYHVMPRFSGNGLRGPSWAKAQVRCHIAAVVLMVPALGFGWTYAFAFGGVLMAASVGLFIWTIWPALRPLRPRPGTIPLTIKRQPQ
jgi:hypothetical protein